MPYWSPKPPLGGSDLGRGEGTYRVQRIFLWLFPSKEPEAGGGGVGTEHEVISVSVTINSRTTPSLARSPEFRFNIAHLVPVTFKSKDFSNTPAGFFFAIRHLPQHICPPRVTMQRACPTVKTTSFKKFTGVLVFAVLSSFALLPQL